MGLKNRVRQLREEQGLTQKQLGEKVNVSRQAINAVETGKFDPSLWLAYDIAQLFNKSIEEGWASFIISQNMNFVGIGMIGVAIIVDTLSALRRKRYDEYQIVLLEKVFLFNGLFTAVLFPLSLVVLILAPMYFVETIFALILFQWIASIKLFFGKVHITGLLPL